MAFLVIRELNAAVRMYFATGCIFPSSLQRLFSRIVHGRYSAYCFHGMHHGLEIAMKSSQISSRVRFAVLSARVSTERQAIKDLSIPDQLQRMRADRKSTRLNSSHQKISYA